MWDGIERRKGPDWIDVGINVLNIVAWCVFIVALIIFDQARPEREYFVHQMANETVEIRKHWLEGLRNWLMISLNACVLISAVTLIMNRFRLKRRDDRKRYGMYMLIVVCLAFLAAVYQSV